MPDRGKQAVIPYEPLIEFVNATITEENWKTVLGELPWSASVEDPDLKLKYRSLGASKPLFLDGEEISGPGPLQTVQERLRLDLACLTDPTWNVVPPAHLAADPDVWMPTMSPDLKEKLRAQAKRVIREPRKNLRWLQTTINGLLINQGIQMRLSDLYSTKNPDDSRLLMTDRVSLVPIIKDLEVWAYFRLANLWSDGLLSRIGCCRNQECQKFFLAKTTRKKRLYCSQQCSQRAQKPTAAKRTKDTRVRRAAWESTREDLERALKARNPASIERAITKAESAFAEAYRRQEGPGYEEGKRLFARAKKQLRQL